jgi:MacB-like protein
LRERIVRHDRSKTSGARAFTPRRSVRARGRRRPVSGGAGTPRRARKGSWRNPRRGNGGAACRARDFRRVLPVQRHQPLREPGRTCRVRPRQRRSTDGPVAVISYRLWRARFDGGSSALGRSLTIDGQAYSLIGVAVPQFLGLSLESSPDLWIASAHSSAPAPQQMIAHLKPGVVASQAQAALDVPFSQLVSPAMTACSSDDRQVAIASKERMWSCQY